MGCHVNSSAIRGHAVLGSEARSPPVPHLGAPREAKVGDERHVHGCEAGLGEGGTWEKLQELVAMVAVGMRDR